MTTKKRYHLVLEAEDMAAILNVARMAGCTRNEWIRRVLRDAVRAASVSVLATEERKWNKT